MCPLESSSLDLFFELQVCMVTWISHRLLKPDVSYSGFFIYVAKAVPFPAVLVLANGATPTRRTLVTPDSWPSISSVSCISSRHCLLSFPSVVALGQVFLISPQDYSSDLIALHSSNEFLLYPVLVFFRKHQSDTILALETRWRLHPRNRQRTWRGQITEEKSTRLHMWKVVHLHYELNVTMTFSHLFNGHFVRTDNKEYKSVEKCPYISLVVDSILEDIWAMFWICGEKQTANYLSASITAFGQIGLVSTLMALRKWDNVGERDL